MSEGDPDLAFSHSPSDDCSAFSSTNSESVSPNVITAEQAFGGGGGSGRGGHRTKVDITMDPLLNVQDTEAGPDVAEEEEFRSASEVFKDPNAFDFLSQHGTAGSGSGGGGGGLHLARESLYVKFDPLVGGRPSVMQRVRREEEEDDGEGGRKDSDPLPGADEQKDLMALQSPSPKKGNREENDDDGATNKTPVRKKPSVDSSPKPLGPQQHLEFQEQLLRKEAQIAEMDKVVQEKFSIIERLKAEVGKRRESEDQMKQVRVEFGNFRQLSRLIILFFRS